LPILFEESECKMDRKLGIGSMVHIVMPDGQHRPAICVRVWDNEGGNFQMFIDGSNDRHNFPGIRPEESHAINAIWMTSVCKAEADENGVHPTRTWHWPEVE
jgi:hypothetical protein